MGGDSSVEIIVEDVGDGLASCLKSVFAQDLLPSRVVVISEHSEIDKDALRTRFSSSLVFLPKTTDPAVTRNEALLGARGDYVMFLESKYQLAPQALAEFVAELDRQREAQFAYPSLGRAGLDWYGRQICFYEQTSGPYQEGKAWFREFFPSYCLFRRAVLERGVRFKPGILNAFRDFWQQFLALGFKPAYVGEALVRLSELAYPDERQTFALLNLATSVAHNPRYYAPHLVPWAQAFLQLCQNATERVSFVFVLKKDSLAKAAVGELAQRLAAGGQLVHVFSEDHKQAAVKDGVSYLALANETCDHLLYQLSLLGRNTVLVSDQRVDILLAARGNPAVAMCVLISSDNQPQEYYGDVLISSGGDICQLRAVEQWSSVVRLDELLSAPGVLAEFIHLVQARVFKRKAKCEELTAKEQSLAEITLAPKLGDRLELSVIVCCRNVDRARLRRCLRSLWQQDFSADVELIISDFGSNAEKREELASLCQEVGARHVYTDARCAWARSLALNIGIQAATKKWVMTTDADMIFAPNFLGMLSCYATAFGAKTVFYAQPVKLSPCRLPLDWQAEHFAEFVKKGRVYGREGKGGCQVAPRELLWRIKGFNENYAVWGCEDEDLYERIGWAGYERIWLRPGYYMHQWHLPNIFQSASESNKKEYQQLRDHPRVVVNGDSWGSENIARINAVDAAVTGANNGARAKGKELEEKLISLDGSPNEQAAIFFELGMEAMQNGQVHSALQVLQDACFLSPQLAEAHVALASVYIQLGIYERAILCVDKALASSPNLSAAKDLREWLRTH